MSTEEFLVRPNLKELRNIEPLLPTLEAMWDTSRVQDLARVGEESSFHGGPGEETVLKHTQMVVDTVAEIVTGRRELFPSQPELQERLTALLELPISTEDPTWTVAGLAVATAITHDIGKRDKIVTNPNGTKSAPGHEEESANVMPEVYDELHSKGITIPADVQDQLTFAVRHHGDLYGLILFDQPADTSELPLEERMQQIGSTMGVTEPRHLTAIMIGALGDFGAGRTGDPDGKYAGQELGFTQAHQDRALQLLAHSLQQIT